jgi:hypothetical protein
MSATAPPSVHNRPRIAHNLNPCDIGDGARIIVYQDGSPEPTHLTIKGFPYVREYNALWVRVIPGGILGHRSLAGMGLVPFADGSWHATAYTLRAPERRTLPLQSGDDSKRFYELLDSTEQDFLKEFECKACGAGYPELIVPVPSYLRAYISTQVLQRPKFRIRLAHED